MRKLLIAPALALMLLLPAAPAPTRAGTFEFEVPAPLIIYIEGTLDANGELEELTGAGCFGTTGAFPWVAIQLQSESESLAFLGATAKTQDKPDKEKAKSRDKSKNAASGEITRIDQEDTPDKAGPRGLATTLTDVKAKMKARFTYVTDPDLSEDSSELAGHFAKVTVKDATNGTKMVAQTDLVAKITDQKDVTCTVNVDTAGRPVGVRLSGLTLNGKAATLHLGR